MILRNSNHTWDLRDSNHVVGVEEFKPCCGSWGIQTMWELRNSNHVACCVCACRAVGFPKAAFLFVCRQRQVNISKWGYIFIIYFGKNNWEWDCFVCLLGAVAWLRLIFNMKIQPLLYAYWVDPKYELGRPKYQLGRPNWVGPIG